MTPSELQDLFELGHEAHGIEFKEGGPLVRGAYLTHVVVRAMLGMANRRDGGVVVLGVPEADGRPAPRGLASEDLSTWTYDGVAEQVNSFADPYVRFDMGHVHVNAVSFVVIEVSEFDQLPVICKKSAPDDGGKPILRRASIYVRTYRKPETTEVPTQTEMRELITLAVEKGVRAFVATARGAGMDVALAPSDSERFDAELGSIDA